MPIFKNTLCAIFLGVTALSSVNAKESQLDLHDLEKCTYFYMHAAASYQENLIQQHQEAHFKTKAALEKSDLFINFRRAFQLSAQLKAFLDTKAIDVSQDNDNLYDEAADILDSKDADKIQKTNLICEPLAKNALDQLTAQQKNALKSEYSLAKTSSLIWNMLKYAPKQ